MQKLMKLIEALEDDDDVQRVTTNFEASDEVMAAGGGVNRGAPRLGRLPYTGAGLQRFAPRPEGGQTPVCDKTPAGRPRPRGDPYALDQSPALRAPARPVFLARGALEGVVAAGGQAHGAVAQIATPPRW